MKRCPKIVQLKRKLKIKKKKPTLACTLTELKCCMNYIKSPDNNMLICLIWFFTSVTAVSVRATTFGLCHCSALHKKKSIFFCNLLKRGMCSFDLYKQARLFHKLQHICFCDKFFASISASGLQTRWLLFLGVFWALNDT